MFTRDTPKSRDDLLSKLNSNLSEDGTNKKQIEPCRAESECLKADCKKAPQLISNHPLSCPEQEYPYIMHRNVCISVTDVHMD